jgi:hypothetical protein
LRTEKPHLTCPKGGKCLFKEEGNQGNTDKKSALFTVVVVRKKGKEEFVICNSIKEIMDIYVTLESGNRVFRLFNVYSDGTTRIVEPVITSRGIMLKTVLLKSEEEPDSFF